MEGRCWLLEEKPFNLVARRLHQGPSPIRQLFLSASIVIKGDWVGRLRSINSDNVVLTDEEVSLPERVQRLSPYCRSKNVSPLKQATAGFFIVNLEPGLAAPKAQDANLSAIGIETREGIG